MDGYEYIRRLKDLRRFLYEHPEQRIVYRDINIDYEIMKTKHEIFLEKDRHDTEISMQAAGKFSSPSAFGDGFVKTAENPFA